MPKSLLFDSHMKMRNNRFMATIAGFIYTRIRPLFLKHSDIPKLTQGDKQSPVTAFICDEMTWQCYRLMNPSFYVTPQNWKQAFAKYKPRILFCESTWAGIDQYKNCWRGQIYKSNRLLYNNRRELFRILDYCKDNGIITVFWNKEDPFYFDDSHYNFIDTALRFDHILTTSMECIPKYRNLGAKSVNLWTFGFPSEIFYPPENEYSKENVAVFAGSWFGNYPERCTDMEQVFDMVLENGIELRIYDRLMYSGNASNKFPDRFTQYICPPVQFEELGDIYRKVKYVINVNTVKDSQTMFARRVFEAMACGCVVISNDSNGLKAVFGDKIWFLNEQFRHDLCGDVVKNNMDYVNLNHICKKRWQELNILLRN